MPESPQRGGGQEPLTIQPGVYLVEDVSLDVTVMQDRARTACGARTGEQDGQCIFYHAALTRNLLEEQELTAMFPGSLEHGDFQVFLQPKVWIENGRLGGAEALVRWHHPQRGVIYPSDFIPLFEKNGRIRELDLFIFEEVCKTISRWAEEEMELFPVSVNLSRQHFKDENALTPFADIARRYAIPSGIIELELTESIFFDDQGIENVKRQIDAMHAMGFLCSLDDFGAGYSSLGLLMEFDVDVIKLDRRFFLNVERKKTRDVVGGAVVELAGKLGVQTVAEGIETQRQLEFVRDARCDLIQGYLYAKPLPIPEFEEWMKNRSAGV